MSKRIISAQHARTTAAKGKASNPLAEAQAVVPGVVDGQANAFVQAAKQVPAGKMPKADHKAPADTDADQGHKGDQADAQQPVAHDTAPVEATASGAARTMMSAMDSSADQASSGSGSASKGDEPRHHHDATPIFFGVGALAAGGAIAAVAGGHHGSSTPTPTPSSNHAPTFAAATQTIASFAENQATTTTVLTATATDADAGDTVTYTLGGADAALFAVSSAGVVTFKASPDFETPTDTGKDNVYNFTVTATDKSGATAVQTETVTVTNVNETPTITGGAGPVALNVFENSTVVTTVKGADVDANTTLTYSISGGLDSALFNIDTSTGALSFKAAPNFEVPTDNGANNVYDVIVKAADNANPSLSTTQAIAVTVVNVNEAPIGVNDTATATEKGGTANGSGGVGGSGNVLTNDTDVDAGTTLSVTAIRTGGTEGSGTAGTLGTALVGAHGTLNISSTGAYTYVVNESDSAVQALNSGGTITDSFNYTVSDSGIPGAATPVITDTAVLVVTINGANDAPVAVDDAGSATEKGGIANATGGSNATGNVLTNDTDVDTGTTLAVASIRAGGTEGAGTAGTLGTGLVGAHGTLTIAANGVYTYVVNEADTAVQALNTGGTITDAFNYTASDGSLTDTGVLTITINGANDAPAINSLAAGSVNENAPTTTVVYTAHATDVDNSTGLVYGLSGTDQNAFNINTGTGEVTLKASADFEAKASYSINVTATDTGGLVATKAVTINVTDQVDTVNLPSNGTLNVGIQAAGQTDQNTKIAVDADTQSSVIVNNFTVNDIIAVIHSSGNQNDVGFQRDGGDLHDLDIIFADTTNNTTTTIVLNDVLGDVGPVFDEATAAIAMGQTGRDFFSFG